MWAAQRARACAQCAQAFCVPFLYPITVLPPLAYLASSLCGCARAHPLHPLDAALASTALTTTSNSSATTAAARSASAAGATTLTPKLFGSSRATSGLCAIRKLATCRRLPWIRRVTTCTIARTSRRCSGSSVARSRCGRCRCRSASSSRCGRRRTMARWTRHERK